MKKKEYAVGEVFRHADGKVYRCVESKICKGCAFKYRDTGCLYGLNCRSTDREDGRAVKFIAVTEPSDGMLFRAENGRMYRLTRGDHCDNVCACDAGAPLSYPTLDTAVFGHIISKEWYWAPVEEDAPVEPPKPAEPPTRHIWLTVVKVEGDTVKFKIVDQTHRCDGFSRQHNSREFKAANGLRFRSAAGPEWRSVDSFLLCRGFDRGSDDVVLACTATEFARICEAVAEYNATDGKGYEKSWPRVGDEYFYITTEGRVDHGIFDMHKFDRMMQDFGNFFRTEEEAKAALERVRQALKK